MADMPADVPDYLATLLQILHVCPNYTFTWITLSIDGKLDLPIVQVMNESLAYSPWLLLQVYLRRERRAVG